MGIKKLLSIVLIFSIYLAASFANAQETQTFAVVTVDANGAVTSCQVDTVQGSLPIVDGAFDTALLLEVIVPNSPVLMQASGEQPRTGYTSVVEADEQVVRKVAVCEDLCL